MNQVRQISDRLARQFIFAVDDRLRRFEGIHEFSDDPQCILRISLVRSRSGCVLDDGTAIAWGDPILELHWWNERIRQLAPPGDNLNWGLHFYTLTDRSLRLLARYLSETPEMRHVAAFHGETSFLTEASYRSHARAFRRVGVELRRLPPAGDTWEQAARLFRHTHVWALTWACNPREIRTGHLFEAVRAEVWLSRRGLLERYLTSGEARRLCGRAQSVGLTR